MNDFENNLSQWKGPIDTESIIYRANKCNQCGHCFLEDTENEIVLLDRCKCGNILISYERNKNA